MRKWNLEYDVPENKQVRVLIYSDAKNEADDQFAIAHFLMTPKCIVEGFVAGHFNGNPQEYGVGNTAKASYAEIEKLEKTDKDAARKLLRELFKEGYILLRTLRLALFAAESEHAVNVHTFGKRVVILFPFAYLFFAFGSRVHRLDIHIHAAALHAEFCIKKLLERCVFIQKQHIKFIHLFIPLIFHKYSISYIYHFVESF